MLTTQFLLVNFHFTASLFAALITFAISWLYLDAWRDKKGPKQATFFFGFFFLSLSFVAQSVIIDQPLFETTLLGSSAALVIKTIFRFTGYITLITGQVLIPLQKRPTHKRGGSGAAILPFLVAPAIDFAPFFLPLLAAAAGLLYFRRATTGLERQLKPVSLGLFMLAFSELLGVAISFRNTQNITLYNLVAPFSFVWIAERVILIIAIYTLGRWVWWYLLKRLETQFFMILNTSILIIFLVITVSFSLATLNHIRADALEGLRSNAKVLAYTIDIKKAVVLADAQATAQIPEVIDAVVNSSRNTLANNLTTTLLAKELTKLTAVSDTGQVILRAHDIEYFGDSFSNDPLIQLALAGRETSSVDIIEETITPVVAVRASIPVWKGDQVVGAILMRSDIDNAFVDGVKEATGLDVSVYADNIRSATTFIAPNGKDRFVGIEEEDEKVKEKVLIEGQTFEGVVDILSVPYLAVFTPLKTFDGNPVGMLFAGRPQTSILQAAGRSIELTFIISAVLLVLSVVPAYKISRYISNQIN